MVSLCWNQNLEVLHGPKQQLPAQTHCRIQLALHPNSQRVYMGMDRILTVRRCDSGDKSGILARVSWSSGGEVATSIERELRIPMISPTAAVVS